LWVGELKGLQLFGHSIVLLRTPDRVLAYEDKCPHLGFPLSKGKLIGNTLTCAAHAWQFDVDCGAGINPADEKLRGYRVEVRDEDIWVDLNPPAAQK
jgi:toluene monooxygenase system ferredoxin subunit